MATTKTAPKSSTTASATKKSFNAGFTLSPRSIKIPKAKAISVAIGIPKPIGFFALNPTYIKAGTTIPPIAATIGNDAFEIEESSPISISLFISRPTIRKKSAINPSFIQLVRLMEIFILPSVTPRRVCHKS